MGRPAKAQQLYAVMRQIRTCFNQLRSLGDVLHEDLGITASMRAVLESVAEAGAQTVPQIAHTKSVSRQHIQVNVDELVKASLVTLQDNPAHKRSPCVVITKSGQSAFGEMRRREKDVLERLASEFRGRKHGEELESTLRVLMQLNGAIVGLREKGVLHGPAN